MPILSAGLSGVAGEYFVAAELSRRGYVASITLRNTRGIDILVSNSDATRSVGVQVKCTQGNFRSWLVKKLDSDELASNLFFVFVSMNGLGEPAYYVVPKNVVAESVEADHSKYLADGEIRGLVRKDTAMRKFRDSDGRFRDRWDLLGLDGPPPGDKLKRPRRRATAESKPRTRAK